MALFHLSVTQTKRSAGQSAIASAAYRAGARLYSEYYGEYSDYTRKGGVICSDILLPSHAPPEYADRQTLWNAVEKAERGKNAQLAYSFDIALQNEFSLEENIALARQFLLENFVSRGMVVDFAVHQPDREDGGIPNPHFHVLCPIRPIEQNGKWGLKQRRVYELDEDGNRIRDANGKFVFNAVPTTDWGSPETLEYWRQTWAELCNGKFAEKGLDVRIDHRSYERQGVELLPTVHEGATVRAMEKKGIRTEKGEFNRWIKATNAVIRDIKKKIALLFDWIAEAKAEIAKPQAPDLVSLLNAYYTQRRAGAYSQKDKVSNLKEMNETFNYLRANGIYSLEDLEHRVSEHSAATESLKKTLDEQTARMKAIKRLYDSSAAFQSLKPVYDGLQKIKFEKPRAKYKAEHETELKQFYAARRTLDRVGEQTGLPTAVAMLDRLEKLSDIRDQGLTFRLEANPNATSYQDQGYLQAGEWNGDSYIPREVIYVGPTDRCRELLYQLEAGDMTARQVRALDQTDSKELEALYLLDDAAYLHIQLRDEGYDYTLYDKETMRLRDGGVIDAEDVALSPIKHPLAAVREEVFDTMGERPEKVEAVPLELVEKLQEAQLEPPAVSSREKLIEHFAAEDAVLFDTELDTYPMPDPSMSMEHLTEAGYTENDLLPLSLDTAELMYGSDFTVYLIRPGENPEMVFDETDFDNHDGLFAVPREEWEASPDFDDAIQNRLREEEQQRREAAFLDHQGDCFALYQLHRGPELRDLRDISLERLRAEGASPRKGNYDLVYTAPLTGQGDTLQQLDQLWHRFKEDHPADYHSPSMSISDIVVLKQGGVLSCHYVDQYAFSELPGFFSGRNPLRAAEDSLEQNDNQLDGILNNTPSVAELEAQVKAGQQVSLVDLAQAVHKEQTEKKKSVVAQLRTAPPAQEQRKKQRKKAQKGSDNHEALYL